MLLVKNIKIKLKIYVKDLSIFLMLDIIGGDSVCKRIK